LLKAKYCPRVAAVSLTQKNKKKHMTLTFDQPMTLKWTTKIVEVYVRAKFYEAKCSGS